MATKAEQRKQAEEKKKQEELARQASENGQREQQDPSSNDVGEGEPNNKGEVTQDGTGAGQKDSSPAMASLSLRRTYSKRLVNLIASLNNTEVEETEDFYLISAPFIKVNRSDVEGVVSGKMSDAKWRMLFVNRSGEIREMSNERFVMGTPAPVVSTDESKDVIQINIRIDAGVKAEMDKYRSKEFLDLTQNAFVEEALREFIENIKKELL